MVAALAMQNQVGGSPTFSTFNPFEAFERLPRRGVRRKAEICEDLVVALLLMQNYYYSPESHGLDMISFEDADLSYEFDILAFWATKDGVVYSASDSGCSCPTPFEDYTSLESLERVGSPEQAESIFKSWNESYGRKKTDPSEGRKAYDWVKSHLK